MAWIVTRFQGLLPCDVYTACKDFVPEFLVISVILTYFIYSFFFLRPFFIRRFRAWTDAEFVLYSLLMIVLTGLWFILSEVFDSGSELFCSIWFFASLISATVSAENKAQNIDIAVHKKSVIWGSLYQQTISAIRQVDDQSINLSTEASFTFSSGYWVWIFVWQLKFYPVHRRPVSWGWDDGRAEILLHPSSFRPLLSGNCTFIPVPKQRKELCVFYRTRTNAYRHCVCPYQLLRFCGTGQLRGLIWTVFK